MSSEERLRLLAWIELRETDYLASFVAEAAAKQRTPAVRQFASQDEARQWVMKEADAIRAPVKWVPEGTERDGLIAD